VLAKEFPERSPVLRCGLRGVRDVAFVAVEHSLQIIALKIKSPYHACLLGMKRLVAAFLW
jgi:hypothetical protein